MTDLLTRLRAKRVVQFGEVITVEIDGERYTGSTGDTVQTRNPDGEEAAARIEALDRVIEGLQIHVGRLVSLYDASDLTWNGKPGFADSRDNNGCVYQSSALATAIEHARTALTAPSMKENEDGR